MSTRPSLFRRMKNLISPPRETYESRQARPGEQADRPGGQTYEATDQRRGMGMGHAG